MDTTMTPRVSEPDSLEQLQSAEQVALLDTVDSLRHQGLGQYGIQLPQLIVCGDQSSGKSSVLEGLTRLRFPTGDTTCTTFATEVVLRKQPVVEIVCTISPAKNRTTSQKSQLSNFRRSFSSLEAFGLPSLINEAKERMNLGAKTRDTVFHEDVLQIKYAGPDVPSLTIVDLPGLIQFSANGQDAERVRHLVKGYMKDPKSIIMAVVSASNDWENQAVFKYVQELDPKSSRTLGIITKPDLLPAESKSTTLFVQLAMNQKMPLHLGWHVVRNRDHGTREASAVERDVSERAFFATGVWSSLPRNDVGIDSLRTKLSKCLLRHVRSELPSLLVTIQQAITNTDYSLRGLGNSRENAEQQRTFLTLKAEKFQYLTRDALRGSYNDRFFSSSTSEDNSIARLRTNIQNFNIAFAHAMYRKGHKWEITDDGVASSVSFGSLSPDTVQLYDAALPAPTCVSRADFLSNNVGSHVRSSRPAGLPSLVNPWVIAEVFREQAQAWRIIAEGHLSYVFNAVETYVDRALQSLMDEQTFGRVKAKHIDRELNRRKEALYAKLEELLTPYEQDEPLTYDPTFLAELEEIRTSRYLKMKASVSRDVLQSANVPQHHLQTSSMDDFTNCEILDLMQAYYRRAISVFISNVTVLGIESCMMRNLEGIFAPSVISAMSETKLGEIATEEQETLDQRAELQQKLEDLKKGKQILDQQAFDTRTTKYKPTQRDPTTLHASEPQRPRSHSRSRPRTPTPPSQLSSDPNDQLDTDGLPITPPSTDPKPRRPKARGTVETPTKNTTSGRAAYGSLGLDPATLTPPYSDDGDDEEV